MQESTKIILAIILMVLICISVDYLSNIRGIKKNKEYLKNIYEFVGTLDSLIAVSSFRQSLDYYSKPELFISNNKSENLIDFEDIYHPLVENPVPSSLRTKNGILVTGSNASGKSTFIKSIAINQMI